MFVASFEVLHTGQGGRKELAVVKPMTNSSVTLTCPLGLREELASTEKLRPVTSSSLGSSSRRLVVFLQGPGKSTAAALSRASAATKGSDELGVRFGWRGAAGGPPVPTRALGPS